jgi:chromosome segregation ATPase
MEPLNSQERARAYYKVTGFFVVCFILAILLGFSTMNVNKVMDYASRNQLEKLKNDLAFQENLFQPNIEDATKNLKELPNYKTKALDLNATKGDIETSLKKIMSGWKVDETDQKYMMYKNIVDIYFALESAYDNNFKLEDRLESKEGDVKTVDGDLQRVIDRRDELERENKMLKSDKGDIASSINKLQNQADVLQRQLLKCRDSLRFYLDENRMQKAEINKLKKTSR